MANPPVRADAHPARPQLADERVDADTVRGEVSGDHEVLRALTAIELPQATEGPRIDVDVENRVDAVFVRRPGDRNAAVRARAMMDGPFPERIVDFPHAQHTPRSRCLNLGDRV